MFNSIDVQYCMCILYYVLYCSDDCSAVLYALKIDPVRMDGDVDLVQCTGEGFVR